MKLTVQNIRKSAKGFKTESQTGTFCTCKRDGKLYACTHPVKTFVKIWTNNNKEREQLLKTLIAKGIPAESGHYANEISFFIP
jgi:hypothetical protein